MKKILVLTIFIVCLFTLVFLFQMRCCMDNPPSLSTVYSDFEDHKDDIQLVLNYLIDCKYKNVYYIKETGEMVADFEKIEIDERPVAEALARLVNSGDFISISKIDTTVSFEMWNGIRDVGCGVAYSIDRNSSPEIEFQTELLALPEQGWYYYIYDYNRWRNSR